ncbi:hypothetical protein HK096_004447 [Nowakowskiella sp. JEL0078]|nr:hypothetical protein HK096_004447 [Nowakowskiella sp. JEL0078]
MELSSPYEFSKDNLPLKQAVAQLRDYGLLFLENVPRDPVGEDKIVKGVAERFGPIQETIYGRLWDIKSESDAINIAYTELGLGLHIDMSYIESPPGLQYLHCLVNTCDGGESLYVDSYAAVKQLQTEYPEDFEVLRKVPVTFHYKNNGHHFHYRRPTIVYNDFTSVHTLNDNLNVFYAPPFQGILEASPELVEKFYCAFRRFSGILQRKEMIYETKLKAGDMVIFANRRILHARKAFDATSGDRILSGCYTDWTDFKDRVRVFEV